MTATARLDMRLQPSLKQDAGRAATLIGARSLTEFVVQAIRDKTASVFDEKEHITLPRLAFDDFLTLGICLSELGTTYCRQRLVVHLHHMKTVKYDVGVR